MIPAETIAEVKSQHELISFIECAGVKLKRHGESHLGLCPLHDDHRPSLSVSASKQTWCCLGACSVPGKIVGGDVIEFARRLWGVSFRDALQRLGGTLSVSIPTPAPHRVPSMLRAVPIRSRPPRGPGGSETALLARVASFYHQGFLGSAEAKEYAASRGLTSAELLSALPVGFADGALLERAPEGSDSYAELQALGLVTSNGHELFARCFVFPLRDLSGNVVSFYGRSIDRDQHLYLPGPRRGLMNAACAGLADELVLAESVIDALSFLHAGIPNAIPLYGTNGWTPDHEALLEQHRIRRIVMALDADTAGRKTAAALADKLRARGISVLDVVLPVKDPNQLLMAEGAEGFATTWKRLLSEAASRRPEPPASAAKEEGGPGRPAADGRAADSEAVSDDTGDTGDTVPLVLDESGTYVLVIEPRTWRIRGLSSVGVDRLRVNLRVDQAQRFHVDTFDLYSARSRNAFIEAAVKALRLDADRETPTVTAEIDEVIQALERERLALRQKGTAEETKAAMTAADREEALAFLKAPDLIARLLADFVEVGCVGEDTALLVGYLAALSRKLPEPLSVLFCARSGAGKSNLQERITDFVPPEDLIRYTRITGQALFYQDENALVHKLLAIDEEEGAAEAAYSLRNLQSGGSLSVSSTRTDPQTGKQKAETYRVNGPTTIFLTSARPEALDYETRNRFVILTVDESKDQTRKILERQRWADTLEGLIVSEKKNEVFNRHRNAQRLIEPLRVVNPFAPQLAYPADRLILRREQKKFLTLIKTVALLHQHQRVRRSVLVAGVAVPYIEASASDVATAQALAPLILRRNLDELAPPTRSLLVEIRRLLAAKKDARKPAPQVSAVPQGAPAPATPRLGLTMSREEEPLTIDRHELQKSTGLSSWHLKAYLAQLVEYEYLSLVTGRKGKRCVYELLWEGEEDDPAALLTDPGAPAVA